jgi:alpha-tubulin suppressor-like RCC1 family protein
VISWGGLAGSKESLKCDFDDYVLLEPKGAITTDVRRLISSEGAQGFLALKNDGSLFAWGHPSVFGPRHNNDPVHTIISEEGRGASAYCTRTLPNVHTAVLLSYGAVVVHKDGQLSSFGRLQENTKDMADWELCKQTLNCIATHGGAIDVIGTMWSNQNKEAFACLCADGTVVSWGDLNIMGQVGNPEFSHVEVIF